ncbi:unnamed protein product [Albugo candida]|nr:unnamed protein product [Albugo candida]|eukprot:CCI42241.1 unnamed protein product [Albugo candida]
MYYPHDKIEWNLYPSCSDAVSLAPLSCSGRENMSYQHPAAYHAVSEQYPWTFGSPQIMSPQYPAYKYRRRRNSMHKPADRIKERNGKSLCIRYITKGTCIYGNKCKFFHDKNGSNTSKQSTSFHENYEKRHRSMSAEGSSGSARYVRRTDGKPKSQPLLYNMYRDAYHKLLILLIRIMYSDWDTFPSLENSMTNTIKSRRNNSGASKLFFRDAVLKQQAKTSSEDSSNQKEGNFVTSSSTGKTKKLDPEFRSRRDRNQDNQSVVVDLDSPPYCDESYEAMPTLYTTPNEEFSSGQFEYTNVYPNALDSNEQTSRFSELSREMEAFVERLDAEVFYLEHHQRQAIASLQKVVQELWHDALIEIYGSTYTRLALSTSDIDCVLVSPSCEHNSPSCVLQEIANRIALQPDLYRLELLTNAKIPVLKVVYQVKSQTGQMRSILLDLTCAHSPGHSGLSARDLVFSYQTQMPALRPLVLVLKRHLKALGLNCAFTGGLSSYALVLLVVRFLQACGDYHQRIEEPFFPPGRWNEQDDTCPEKSPVDSSSLYVFTRESSSSLWKADIGALLLLFLETYTTFDFRRFGISVEHGGYVLSLCDRAKLTVLCFMSREFYLLGIDHACMDPGSVIKPMISDPMQPGRMIGSCFRLHEVLRAWSDLYQHLCSHGELSQMLPAV